MSKEKLRNAIVHNLSRRARELREARVKWESWFAYEYKPEARSILNIFDNLGEICEPTDEYPIEIGMLRDDISPSEQDRETEKQNIIDRCVECVAAQYEKDKYSGREVLGLLQTLLRKIDPIWQAELKDKL